MSNVPAKRSVGDIINLPEGELTDQEKRIKEMYLGATQDQANDTQMGRGVFLKVEVNATKEGSYFMVPGLPPQKELEAIVIYACVVRYLYDPDNDQGPLFCRSTGGKTGSPTDEGKKIMPFLQVGPYNCTGCPANVYGSGKEGRGKLCKEKRRLYLGLRGMKSYVRVDVPPTSCGTWDGYKASCDSNTKLLCGMLTKMTLQSATAGSRVWALFRFEAGVDLSLEDLKVAMDFKDTVVDMIRGGQVPDDDEVKDTKVAEQPAQNEPPPPSDADRPPETESNDDLPF